MRSLLVFIALVAICCAAVATAVLEKDKSVCQLPKVNGPCRARLQNFYYNSATNKCEKFEFGGCEGNGNRFKKLKDCQELCVETVL